MQKRGLNMNKDFKSEKRLMDIIIEKLEERHILDHWEAYLYKIKDTWVNKTCK
jgi:hypothetical protein